jgi:hypothetical protein
MFLAMKQYANPLSKKKKKQIMRMVALNTANLLVEIPNIHQNKTEKTF